MPDELATIETEHNEVYEKRHQRIEERIAVYNDLIAKEGESDTAPEPTPETEEDTPRNEAEIPQTQETAA